MRKFLVVFALFVLPLSAARAQSCPGVAPWVFVDVAASHAFCTYVTWMAQTGVTTGCRIIDANNREYCPDDSVSRLQMAAFMNRLGNALFPLTCAAGQVMKWNGAAWTCSDDNTGGSGGGGTVTSVLAGTGLAASPNPIVGAGVLNLALSFQLPQACANGQVPKSNGAGGWTCQNDNDTNSGGTVTSVIAGAGLTGGTITTAGTIAVNTTTIQARVIGTCAVGSSIRAIDAAGNVTCETDDAGPANAFVQGGNAFGATATLGTSDNRTLSLMANNVTSLRVQPTTADPVNGYDTATPNVIWGWVVNAASAGVIGATIGGGGGDIGAVLQYNLVTDHYGTVGGGSGNRAGDALGTIRDRSHATVSGGSGNRASGNSSTVSGGSGNNASGLAATVGGGSGNTASGLRSSVVGGLTNIASGQDSTVSGGALNTAQGLATVGGGFSNQASGDLSAVSGGLGNIASGTTSMVAGGEANVASGFRSFAAGTRARTQTADVTPTVHDGAFVWSDSNDFDFNTTANNEFAVRATGGVRFVTAINGTGVPTRTLRVNPNSELEFGAVTRQMLNLWGTTWGIGVQPSTQYFRTGNHFGWYLNGVHTDSPLDPGGNGATLMTLTNGASTSVVIGTLRAQVVTATSDRAQKLDFAVVDGQEVLARVVAMPIATWAYRNEPAVRHMGPTGQAFREAFALGSDDKSIATVDADGVALAAIKGLNEKLETTIAAQAQALAAERAAREGQAREIVELRQLVEQLIATR